MLEDNSENEEGSAWFVYMILTNQHTFYTGITKDLQRRFQEHLDTFNGKYKARGAKFFRTVKPLKIVHTESFENRSQASQREAAIKALNKADKQKLFI